MMQKSKACLSSILLALLITACSTIPSDPATQILGDWQSEVGGFAVVSTYTADKVSVDRHNPIDYTLDGNRLMIDGDPMTVRIISFPGKGQMIQLDPVTGTAHLYTRATR
jgi:hypothetical protein